MADALKTDLYELTLAASYLKQGMTGPATFSLFVRGLPPTRGFLVAAGLESCLSFLEDFRIEEADLEYLSRVGFEEDSLALLEGLRFSGDVWAVPEGRLVFAQEPIVEVTAPIAQAQLMETYLLNQVSFQTSLASKAARYRLAAGDRIELVDFAFRRAHGIEAAMAVARLSAMVGFSATSNVEAARRLGLRPSGTMAHSYVEAFPKEIEAFRAYASDHVGPLTFLVDTYDTGTGVQAAIEVIDQLGLEAPIGIRLDSGDLDDLAQRAREALDASGHSEVRIVASGGLDETDVERLVTSGVPVDAVGIGTRMGVSADAPSLDTGYKLVAYDGRPVLKLSTGKATLPGAKQVFRRDEPLLDVLALRDETAPAGTAPLMEQVMKGGERLQETAGAGTGSSVLAAGRAAFERDMALLPPSARDIEVPVAPGPNLSDRLVKLTEELTGKLRASAD